MSFPSTLDSTAYTKLRGNGAVAPTYSADQYLCLGANTTVFAARVNQATFGDSFAQVTFDTVTTGAYTDVETDMTVLISHTDDRRAAFVVGRVRLAPTSAILYINETSAAVADNDYIFVLNDFRLFGKLGRESAAVYYKDYANTFTPPGPLIYNLQSAYAGVVSGSPVGYTVSFAPLALAVTSGATISSYAWTIPSGGTITVGDANTQDITVRFDARAAEYWVKLIVTDSGGRTSTRRIPVWAIPADLSTTVALGFEGAQIERNIDSGHLASVNAFTGVDTLLDNTLVCILSVERYNDAETYIVSNIDFVGRIRTGQHSTRADFIYSRLAEGAYDIEGVGAQLARISAPSIYMRSKTSPAVWDEIKDLTLWRAMWYLLFHSTFHELHSLTFDETGTTYLSPAIQTQGGNLFDAISDLAQSITAGMEFAASGECKIARNADYQTTSERNALTTVANFTEDDWLDFNYTHEEIETIGAVGGDGGSFNSTSGKVLALLGNAPKVAQGNADGTSALPRQILTANLTKLGAQTELAARLGHHYAFANPVDTLDVTFPDGYHWLIPSNAQWYTFTIAASENTNGRAFTTNERWQCQGVSYSHNHATGGREVTASFRRESSGTPGKAYEPPANSEGTINIPPIPPTPPFSPLNTPPDIYLPPNPNPEDVPPPLVFDVPLNGNSQIMGTALAVYSTTNFLQTNSPDYLEITPPELNGTIRGGAFGVSREFYLLESDDVNSWVWFTEDPFANPPAWTMSETLEGMYTVIRATSTQGEVYILTDLDSETALDYDFTAGQQGWTAASDGGGALAVYSAGNGWEDNHPANEDGIYIDSPIFAAGNLIRVSVYFSTEWNGGNPQIFAKDTAQTVDYGTTSSFGHTNIIFGCDGTSVTEVRIIADPNVGGTQGFDGYITRILLYFGTGGAATRYSPDFGATFGDPVSLGDAAGGGGGLDTIRIDTAVLAGSDGQVKIATSAGGAYSNHGSAMPAGAQPNALHIPRLQFGGSSPNVVGTLHHLVASGTLSSNAALWKSIDGTLTDITPTDGSDYFTAVSPNCIHMPWWSGSKMVSIGDYDGTRRLKVSTNTGVAWTGAATPLSSNAVYIRYRKGDQQARQLFIADTVPVYSGDHGGTLYAKAHPSPSGSLIDPLIFIEPYG